jgi:hypothetical protein
MQSKSGEATLFNPCVGKADDCPSDMIAGSQRRKKKTLRERERHMHSEVAVDDVEEGSS